MATHSSVLAWRIPWTEEPGGPQSMGWQELDMTQPLRDRERAKEKQIFTYLVNVNEEMAVLIPKEV